MRTAPFGVSETSCQGHPNRYLAADLRPLTALGIALHS
jgi:hypothetical protein